MDAAQRCFIRRGFHQTSMQDVFAESGLSAGAVYRYFKSKDDLVIELASTHAAGVRAMLAEAMAGDPLPTPAEVIARASGFLTAHGGPEGRLRLAPQAWALAMVDASAAEPIRQAMRGIREVWRDYVGRMADQGWLPADADLDAVAATLFGMLPGFVLQAQILGDVDTAALERGSRALFPYGANESAR